MQTKRKTPTPTSHEIKELVAFLPRLYSEDFDPVKKWHGGDKDDEGLITMPFPEYETVVSEFFCVASDDCWTDYDYLSESKRQLLDNKDAVKTASIDQIKTMLTHCVRGERFCTGHWAAVINDGYVQRILQRLEEFGAEAGNIEVTSDSY